MLELQPGLQIHDVNPGWSKVQPPAATALVTSVRSPSIGAPGITPKQHLYVLPTPRRVGRIAEISRRPPDIVPRIALEAPATAGAAVSLAGAGVSRWGIQICIGCIAHIPGEGGVDPGEVATDGDGFRERPSKLDQLLALGEALEVSDTWSESGEMMADGSSVCVGKELSTEHIRRGVHYRRSDQDVDNLATAADVVLETKDALFPSHSSILGLNSSVFCDMLASQTASRRDAEQGGACREANGNACTNASGHQVSQEGNKTVVRLTDETRDVKQFLRFLYDRHSSKHGLVRSNGVDEHWT